MSHILLVLTRPKPRPLEPGHRPRLVVLACSSSRGNTASRCREMAKDMVASAQCQAEFTVSEGVSPLQCAGSYLVVRVATVGQLLPSRVPAASHPAGVETVAGGSDSRGETGLGATADRHAQLRPAARRPPVAGAPSRPVRGRCQPSGVVTVLVLILIGLAAAVACFIALARANRERTRSELRSIATELLTQTGDSLSQRLADQRRVEEERSAGEMARRAEEFKGLVTPMHEKLARMDS